MFILYCCINVLKVKISAQNTDLKCVIVEDVFLFGAEHTLGPKTPRIPGNPDSPGSP